MKPHRIEAGAGVGAARDKVADLKRRKGRLGTIPPDKPTRDLLLSDRAWNVPWCLRRCGRRPVDAVTQRPFFVGIGQVICAICICLSQIVLYFEKSVYLFDTGNLYFVIVLTCSWSRDIIKVSQASDPQAIGHRKRTRQIRNGCGTRPVRSLEGQGPRWNGTLPTSQFASQDLALDARHVGSAILQFGPPAPLDLAKRLGRHRLVRFDHDKLVAAALFGRERCRFGRERCRFGQACCRALPCGAIVDPFPGLIVNARQPACRTAANGLRAAMRRRGSRVIA